MLKESMLWNVIQDKSKHIETNMDPFERKRTGSYYTHISLTAVMMHELVERIRSLNKPIEEFTFLEPCVGTGNFVFSYINEAYMLGINRTKAEILLNNIYVADVNISALNIYMETLKELAFLFWKIELDDTYFRTHVGSALLVDVTADTINYIPIDNVFDPDIINRGFDIVVTNPPYKNLKAERSQYVSGEEYETDRNKYLAVLKVATKKFKYSVDGVLNLYKLFVEEIVDKYAAKDAFISLLIPSSILSDKTCEKIRTHILQDMNLISVKFIGEKNSFLDTRQALSAILIHKGEHTKNIQITKDYCKFPNDTSALDIGDVINENTGNSIYAITKEENEVLKKLRKFPTVKDIAFIVNLRGELDLTANKNHITNETTPFKLIRGRNIAYYEMNSEEVSEYVKAEFVKGTTKNRYINCERIACHQIANMNKERRITFTLVPKGFVLGNSCNFISVAENDYGIDIYSLLGLFNTKIINWMFKLTSSNNHVNNYEIDTFPVPIKSGLLRIISEKVREYLSFGNEKVIDEIELLARKAYNLDAESEGNDGCEIKTIKMYQNSVAKLHIELSYNDAKLILTSNKSIDKYIHNLSNFEINVIKGITDKFQKLYNGYILNHTTFKLSDLDLEMIRAVPPGGSWKDIPQETVEKSKRLTRITQTGGRTTLYGRIDYNKPSYTITTYFNRPGNGTYVHPTLERVISVREAARFQTFRDDYYFFGNKTQILKQVGNAVPTILAYQIAKKIKEKTGCYRTIDLFCGAGGMTSGFKAAGIISLLSNDIEESACTTLKINNPEIPVLCGDITKDEIKGKIEKEAKEGGADIICGGPPCQGFSLAGFRSESDPRNQLFRDFVDIVRRIEPKVIVFENVEGLLSYQGGRTYQEVHTLFSELGYWTEGRTLMANDYAVPQKRKRVIIICTRKDINTYPSELFPDMITRQDFNQVTAKETIFDLETVKCEENAKYNSDYISDIIQFFKGEISYEDFLCGRANSESMQFNDTMIEVDGQFAFRF